MTKRISGVLGLVIAMVLSGVMAMAQQCPGDCDGSGDVTVDELLKLVNIDLGTADVSTCLAGDITHDNEITIDEILIAVNNALSACPGGPTPTPTSVTLTMEDLPAQPVDGLSIAGVTFGFTIGGTPSNDGTYAGFGPGVQHFTQDPGIEGNTQGVLTLTFGTPTRILEFGVTLSSAGTLTPGVSVELFDANLNSLGVTDVNTSQVAGDSFTGGQLTYSGTPVRRAIVSFNGSAERFAFDNLTFAGAGGAGPGGPLCGCCACDFGGADIECGLGDIDCQGCTNQGGTPAADCSVCSSSCSEGVNLCSGNPQGCLSGSAGVPAAGPLVALGRANAAGDPYIWSARVSNWLK